jgi:hypothetical protein
MNLNRIYNGLHYLQNFNISAASVLVGIVIYGDFLYCLLALYLCTVSISFIPQAAGGGVHNFVQPMRARLVPLASPFWTVAKYSSFSVGSARMVFAPSFQLAGHTSP